MKRIKLTRRLSVRLSLIFAVTLFISGIGIATVVYYSLTETIKRTEFSALEDRSTEYQFAFSKGGIPALTELISLQEKQDRKRKIFVSVEDPHKIIFQNAFALSNLSTNNFSPGWNLRLIDEGLPRENFLKEMEFRLRSFALEKGWTALLPFLNFEIMYIHRSKLSDDLWLNVGHPLRQSEKEFLKVRMLGLQLLGFFTFVGLVMAWALSRKVISPLHSFFETIREIESGNSSARVKPSGSKDELDLLAVEFNSLMDSKEALVENMNTTLDTIAHEIRTPVTRFRIGAELALSGKNIPGILEGAVIDGLDASERISTLLTNVMDSSRSRSGLIKPKLTKFNLAELCKELNDIYQFLLEEKNIKLAVNVPGDLNITADRGLLLQGLNNLIDNAIKYSPVNGTITVTAEKKTEEISISVSDNGIGIKESELPKIWERLYRSPQSGNETGYGIGLSIVKQVAEIHGGKAEVISRLGSGSTFSLKLPNI